MHRERGDLFGAYVTHGFIAAEGSDPSVEDCHRARANGGRTVEDPQIHDVVASHALVER